MKTTPLKHQIDCYNAIKDKAFFALFLEQGLGKTKIAVDDFFRLYDEGKITAVLIIAPNGVHLNWFYEEIPKHAWHQDYRMHLWDSKTTRTAQQELHKFTESTDNRLKIFIAPVSAVKIDRAFQYMRKFMSSFSTYLVMDESSVIKNPKALQTKQALKLAPLSQYRRILNGTPITQSPLDLFSQCLFLSKDAMPYRSYTAFKHAFAVEKLVTMGPRAFHKVIGYQNLDVLTKDIKHFSLRLTKEDCLDLPDKTYSRQVVEMTEQQSRMYLRIKNQQVALIEAEEQRTGVVTATSVLSALIKLQQVCCGFVVDDQHVIHDLPSTRLDALCSVIGDYPQKTVIWTTFLHNLRQIKERLTEQYGPDSCVTYFGETSQEDKSAVVSRFQNNDKPLFFIATKAASRGLTLHAASRTIYYSNSYSYGDRLQSEDRIHRIGQRHPCFYTDLYCPNTVEVTILNTLKNKQKLSETIFGNNWKNLLF
jgi:SNF2 family DNA or RNA helicase